MSFNRSFFLLHGLEIFIEFLFLVFFVSLPLRFIIRNIIRSLNHSESEEILRLRLKNKTEKQQKEFNKNFFLPFSMIHCFPFDPSNGSAFPFLVFRYR